MKFKKGDEVYVLEKNNTNAMPGFCKIKSIEKNKYEKGMDCFYVWKYEKNPSKVQHVASGYLQLASLRQSPDIRDITKQMENM